MIATLTVIVRTLGRPSLAAALASVDAQRRDDVEIVLVDASGAIAHAPATASPLRLVGRGVALQRCVAANAGLDAVRTPLALFLDDDDVLLAGHLDKLVRALQREPGAIAAHTGVELVGPGAQPPYRVLDQAFERWQLLVCNQLPIHAAAFRADAVRAAGARFDESLELFEDWDFWLQVSALGPFVHVGGASARYHVAAGESGVHTLDFGAPEYWRIWDKWRSRVPPALWAEVLAGAQRGIAADRDPRTRPEALDALQDGLRQSRAAVSRIRHQRDALQAQVSALQQQVQHLRDSTSWRLTAPLRWAVDRVHARPARTVEPAATVPPAPPPSAEVHGDRYTEWVARHDQWDDARADHAQQRLAKLTRRPLVSIVMPVYNPDPAFLDQAIESVRAQVFPDWELCIADDASTAPGARAQLDAWAARDARIRVIVREANGHIAECSNTALGLARGDWIALLDQDDLLAPDALLQVALAIDHHADAGLVYSDEDKLDDQGRRFSAYFKPAFDLELLRGQNTISHFGVYRRTLVEAVGGFRRGFDGSQDHDLALRCVESLRPGQVIHVPRVLYHWRVHAGSAAGDIAAKPYALAAGLRAVQQHLDRVEPGATVELQPAAAQYRVRYPLPQPLPQIDVLVHGELPDTGLMPWLADWLLGTDYDRALLRVVLPAAPEPGEAPPYGMHGRVLHLPGRSPNGLVAAWNELAAVSPRPLLLLMRAGVRPAAAHWLIEMVAHALRPNVAAVGGRVDSAVQGLCAGRLIVTDEGSAVVANLGLPAGQAGDCARELLAQSASALGASCTLFNRAALGADAAPLDAAIDDPDRAAIDATRRARRCGRRLIYAPLAALQLDDAVKVLPPSRWDAVDSGGDDPTHNPNLALQAPTTSPSWPPRGGHARPGPS